MAIVWDGAGRNSKAAQLMWQTAVHVSFLAGCSSLNHKLNYPYAFHLATREGVLLACSCAGCGG